MTHGTKLFLAAAVAALLLAARPALAEEPVATAPIPPPPPAAPLTPAAPAVVSPEPPPKFSAPKQAAPATTQAAPATTGVAPKSWAKPDLRETAIQAAAKVAARKAETASARRPKRPALNEASVPKPGSQKPAPERLAAEKPEKVAAQKPAERPRRNRMRSGKPGIAAAAPSSGWGSTAEGDARPRYYAQPRYYDEPGDYADTYPRDPVSDAPPYPRGPAGYGAPYPPPWYAGPPPDRYPGPRRRGPLPPWHEID